MSDEQGKPDQESLIALQALMKIRSEKCEERPDGSGACSETKQSPPETPGSTSVTAPVPSSPFLMNPQVIRSNLPLQMAVNIHGGLPITVPMNPLVAVPSNPKASPNHFFQPVPAPPHPPGLAHAESHQPSSPTKTEEGASGNAESPQAQAIRQDQIEAALRSKPQRGRKRENLSVLERLELTRTRNREHAKSTRIRKKARYQDLLEKEAKYEELLKAQDLTSRRRETMIKFLSTRAKMSQRRSCTSSDEDSGNPDKEILDLLHDPFTFTFAADGIGYKPGAINDYKASMKAFDDVFCCNVEASLGSSALPVVKYNVVGGAKGAAINQAGEGFAEINCTVEINERRKSVLEAIVRFQFSPESEKLLAVRFTTVSDFLAQGTNEGRRPSGDGESPSSDSVESLGYQKSYPSVVSLDPVHTTSEERGRQPDSSRPGGEGDLGNGIGMNI